MCGFWHFQNSISSKVTTVIRSISYPKPSVYKHTSSKDLLSALNPEPTGCINSMFPHLFINGALEMLHVNCHEAQVRDAAFLCREQTGWPQMMAKYLLEGALQVSSPTSCSMQGQRWDQTGCSGLCPVKSWKPLRTGTVEPFWAACSAVWLSSWGKGYMPSTVFYPVWASLLWAYAPYAFVISQLALPGGAGLALCPQSSLAGRHCGAAARSTWSSPFSQDKCSSLSHLGFSPQSLLDLTGLSCVRVPKTGHYSRCGLST